MPYTIEWLVPERVFIFQFWDKISVQEAINANESFAKFIGEGQAPVHVIGIAGANAAIPPDISLLSRKSAMSSPNFGHLVVVGASGIVRFIAQVVTAIIQAKVQMADSLDAAYQILVEKDSSLPPELPKTND